MIFLNMWLCVWLISWHINCSDKVFDWLKLLVIFLIQVRLDYDSTSGIKLSWFIGLFLVWIMRYLGLVGPDGIWEKIIFGPSVHEYGLRYIISDSIIYFFFSRKILLWLSWSYLKRGKKNGDIIWVKGDFVKCFKFLLWLLIDFFLVKERKSKFFFCFFFWFLWYGKRLFPRVEEKTTPCQISNEKESLTNRQWCIRCFDLGFRSLKFRVKWRERERAKKKNIRPRCFKESWLN